MKRKAEFGGSEPKNLKRFRSVISKFNKEHTSDWAMIQGSGGKRELEKRTKTQTRKERRKEERKLKKKRKMAFVQHKPLPTKESLDKEKTQAEKAERLKKQKEKKREKKKEKKRKKRQQEKEKEDTYQQGLKEANKSEDKMIKQLEKQLKLKKKKGKKLPLGFQNDGLDYILDVVDIDHKSGMPGVGSDDEDADDEIPKASWELEDEEESEGDSADESDPEEPDLGDDSDPDLDSGSENVPSDLDLQTNSDEEEIEPKSSKKDKTSKKSVRFSVESKDDDDSMEPDKFSKKNPKSKTKSDKKSEKSKQSQDKSLKFSKSEDVNSESSEDFDEDFDEDFGDDSDEEFLDDEGSNEETKGPVLKEDIYGRLRDDSGNVVDQGKTGSYIPPGRRQEMLGKTADGRKQLELEKLKKQMKGLLNRLSESNLQSISTEIEDLYRTNSRMEMTEMLTSLVLGACVSVTAIPERLVMEHILLVALLHSNVGTEVGAYFLQTVVKKLDNLMSVENYGLGKEIDNVMVVLAYLYNFKVVQSVLMFDVLKKLAESFQERDVEMLLLLLKNIGATLRKDDPGSLKDIIILIQSKASAMDTSKAADQSRVRFMLEVLLAVKNNNLRKIPNYDPSHMEHLRKVLRHCVHASSSADTELHITLADLLDADTRGRWWLVGSAWAGRGDGTTTTETTPSSGQTEVSAHILQLAKQQRMNTDVRKNIFCVIMTSEDFVDAFEKLLHLGLKHRQEREIVHVIIDLCVQEKTFNPFYALLAQKFCEYDRRFQMTVQFTLWDKFKTLEDLGESRLSNLASFLCHLLATKALSLSVFKVIEFGELDKTRVRYLKKVLSSILLEQPSHVIVDIFSRIAALPKLQILREGLKLFIRHFLLRDKKAMLEETFDLLKKNVELAEKSLSSLEERMVL